MVSFAVVAAEVRLKFLRNQPNLNSSGVSAFFSCNVIDGRNLAWTINSRGIGVFDVNDVLDGVKAGIQSNYSYIATTLSRRNGFSLYNFDSVLIVSTSNDNPVLRVGCLSDSEYNSTNNLVTPPGHVICTQPGGSPILYMLPVLTNLNIVGGVNTSIFICASSGQDQLWTTNMNDRIGLDSNSNFGSQHSRSTTNRNSLRLQAISLGQQNQHLLSILYVSDDAVRIVGCSANRSIVEYPDDFETGMPGMQWLICDLLIFHFASSF